MGHSRRYWLEFRDRVNAAVISAVHDAAFWKLANDNMIDYVRRRWSHYHVCSQIRLAAAISVWFPLFLFLKYGKTIRISVVTFFSYEAALVVVIAATSVTCYLVRQSIDCFMEELLKDQDERIRERLDKLAQSTIAGRSKHATASPPDTREANKHGIT